MLAWRVDRLVDDYNEDRQAPLLGWRAATKAWCCSPVSRSGLWARRQNDTGLKRRPLPTLRRRHVDLGAAYPVLIYLVVGRDDQRRQPDRPASTALRAAAAQIVVLATSRSPPVSGRTSWSCFRRASLAPGVGFLWFQRVSRDDLHGDNGSLGSGARSRASRS